MLDKHLRDKIKTSGSKQPSYGITPAAAALDPSVRTQAMKSLRPRRGIIPLFGTFVILTFYFYLDTTFLSRCNEISSDELQDFQRNLQNEERLKRVLLWTPYFGRQHWTLSLGQKEFLQCPEQRCEFTADRCLQPVSDAVMFHMPDLYRKSNQFPQLHPEWQIWTIVSWESEVSYDKPDYLDLPDLDDKFNWTASYRLDADIYLPYSHIFHIRQDNNVLEPVAPLRISDLSITKKTLDLSNHYTTNSSIGTLTQPTSQGIDHFTGKDNFALWFVSNCDTTGTNRRMELFKELRKHIPIDVYGDTYECSELGAKRDPCKKDFDCSMRFMYSYKFYLSFENTRCSHYITEKFFRALRAGVVPIVFGAPQKDYEAIAPPDSFLHVSNFSSIENLAKYLQDLASDGDKYNRYLKWKESHVMLQQDNLHAYCKLCSDLWKPQRTPKTYRNFTEWWNKDKHCQSSSLVPLPAASLPLLALITFLVVFNVT